MPSDKKYNHSGNIHLKITMDGGVVVSAYASNGSRSVGADDEMEYVYQNIEEAINELPSIVSIIMENDKERPEKDDLDEMEKEANKNNED